MPWRRAQPFAYRIPMTQIYPYSTRCIRTLCTVALTVAAWNARAQEPADRARADDVVAKIVRAAESIQSLSASYRVSIEEGFDAGQVWQVETYRWMDDRTYLETAGSDTASRSLYGWFQDAPASIHMPLEGSEEPPAVYVFEDGGLGGEFPLLEPSDIFTFAVCGEYGIGERLTQGLPYLYETPQGGTLLVVVDTSSGRREEFHRDEMGRVTLHRYGFIPMSVIESAGTAPEVVTGPDAPFAIDQETVFSAFAPVGDRTLPMSAVRRQFGNEAAPDRLAGLVKLFRDGSMGMNQFQESLALHFSERAVPLQTERVAIERASVIVNPAIDAESLNVAIPENSAIIDARNQRPVTLAELMPEASDDTAPAPRANHSETNLPSDREGLQEATDEETGGGGAGLLAILLLAAVIGGGVFVWRRR